MNKQVVLSPAARHDLIDIWTYISQENEAAATNTIQAIYEQCMALTMSPRMGRNREKELGKGIRSFPIGNFIIFYWIVIDGIEVIRVLHSARDIPSQFD